MSTQVFYNAVPVQTADEVLAEHEQRRRDHAAMQARQQRTDELMARIQTRMLACLDKLDALDARDPVMRNHDEWGSIHQTTAHFKDLAQALGSLNRY